MLSDDDAKAIDRALAQWRQGDVTFDPGLEFVHLANLSRPHSRASREVAGTVEKEAVTQDAVLILDTAVRGLAMLTQTCDVVRGCRDRPFVQVAPLIEVDAEDLEHVRRLKLPALAYVPGTAAQRLVADLDRTMTIEKAVVARWTRTAGWQTDEEIRLFAEALSRKCSRFAFPDDFIRAVSKLQNRLAKKYDRNSEEGAHLRSLFAIRVRAAPSWDEKQVQLSWWFIKESDPSDVKANWPLWAKEWLGLFDQTGRFRIDPPTICRLEDMTGRDYFESDLLDLDRLSRSPSG